jgi:lincosamide nucleotidyltransferase A/C/D/E
VRTKWPTARRVSPARRLASSLGDQQDRSPQRVEGGQDAKLAGSSGTWTECFHAVVAGSAGFRVGIEGSWVMREQDVLGVLAKLADAGLTAWVDGGWGVDALLGVTTREHDDLDLVVRRDEIDQVRHVLAGMGFTAVLRDWLPNALALSDETGKSVDLHPVTVSPDGGGDQATLGGGCFHYLAPVAGVIGGRSVRCVDAATQLLCHSGYELTDKDRTDVANLRRRFGL